MKKLSEKDFFVPWYYRLWLSDQQLKMISLAATGLWAHLISQSCEMPIPGVFAVEKTGENIEVFDEKFGKKFENFSKISENKILEMFAGKMAEKKRVFGELKTFHVIKQSPDGTFYVKVIYRVMQLREKRREVGKQGGNPKLVSGLVDNLDNQNPNQKEDLLNQTDNQKGGYSYPYSNPNPNPVSKVLLQSHSQSCNEGDGKGGYGDDLNYQKNILDLDLMRRISSAKKKLVDSIVARFGPQNGTRIVMSDIVELTVHRAIRDGRVGIFNDVMRWARNAAENKAINNPTGLFVKKCKEKLGYQPRGMVLENEK